ncbi:MAG: hypothetical protein ACK5H1_01140 [Tenacibaculum sp.]
MKRHFLVLIAIFSFIGINAQQFINIGSSSIDVKKVMGEPTSISKNELLKTETWSYGKYGSAKIVFKNNMVYEYYNHDNILKIVKIADKPLKKNSISK